MKRQKSLARSVHWSQTEGTVHQIIWDSSLPREQMVYSYSTDKGYFSGSSWRWFERTSAREVRVGDRLVLRYDPETPEESIFVDFQEGDSSVISVPSVVKRF